MGEGCGSWFSQQQFDWQSPNSNYSSAPIHLGQQNNIPTTMNLGTNMVSTNGILPVKAYPVRPHSQVALANEPGWFYCLPRFRQAFAPASNSILKEHLPAGTIENHGETIKSKARSGCAQKRFLVFDQSGDQTTLMFSSGIGNPVRCPTSWSPKPLGGYNLSREAPGAKGDINFHPGPNLIDELDEPNGADLQSEMQEDTEELNALLYSDDDSDYTDDDDEVTSTGHSPSIMTGQEKQDWFDGSTEEVASSAGPSKKRKHFDGDYDDVPSPIPAGSVKCTSHIDNEDDAESTCANGQNPGSGEFGNLPANKRMRKEKICETVSVLRSIIPDGKGKDGMLVLDEAIDYLNSLKLKAKAFGLDSL